MMKQPVTFIGSKTDTRALKMTKQEENMQTTQKQLKRVKKI